MRSREREDSDRWRQESRNRTSSLGYQAASPLQHRCPRSCHTNPPAPCAARGASISRRPNCPFAVPRPSASSRPSTRNAPQDRPPDRAGSPDTNGFLATPEDRQQTPVHMDSPAWCRKSPCVAFGATTAYAHKSRACPRRRAYWPAQRVSSPAPDPGDRGLLAAF